MDLSEKEKTDLLSDENRVWGKQNTRSISMFLFTNLDNGKEWIVTWFGYTGPGQTNSTAEPSSSFWTAPLGINNDSPMIISNPKCSGEKMGRQFGTFQARVVIYVD